MATSDFVIHPQGEMAPAEVLQTAELPSEKVTPTVKDSSQKGVAITLFQNYVRVQTGMGTYKYYDYRDFLQVIKSAIKEDDESATGGTRKFKLPKNVFAFEIGPTVIRISMYYPEQVRQITFGNDTRARVCPNTIISAKLTQNADRTWAVAEPRFFCTPHSLESLPRNYVENTNASGGIYPLAFSNMYAEGRMCTGENAVVRSLKEDDLRGLTALSEMAFNSPFNRDLGVRAVPSYYNNPQEWFALLAKKATDGQPFPYELLGS